LPSLSEGEFEIGVDGLARSITIDPFGSSRSIWSLVQTPVVKKETLQELSIF